MWSQLQAYDDEHLIEGIIALWEKYYSCKMGDGDSIAMFISMLHKLAGHLTGLRQKVTEQQLISKIRCGFSSLFDPLLLAWDNVFIAKHTLNRLQTCLVNF